ncbi:ankyrin repeat-containing protein ITN1-like [Vigna unguiculata]|uniref:ankyrin repeat-containing protein ITN1-like n=1 Tax=Vigna unguiculata TaxID=3917 RepID=UPI0010165A51|nr:ankyrin repeat-containing protein ITN1-like [Vigna unguiculata]
MSNVEGNDTLSTLYEVSLRGSVSELETLIGRDPLLLHRISLTSFTETPLHISALLGHLDFINSLLTQKPQLALETDHCRRTPLHLASAEGHVEIVHVLLQKCEDACLMSDQDGRIPLHYAAMRGRTEVARQLISGAKSESVMVFDGSGKTVFHLCVEHNHLETLKTLVQVGNVREDFLNSGDFHHGNTILHLAVMFKQIESVRYLLSISKIKEEANIQNKMGYTALDMLDQVPKDMRSLQIKLMLVDAGFKNNENNQVHHPPSASIIDVPPSRTQNPNEKFWSNSLKRVNKLLQLKSGRLEEMRGMLSLVSTMISTVTFGVVMNPPGGDLSIHPLLRMQYEEMFTSFLTMNTISFIASLGVTLLLISGVPLKNEVTMGLLSVGTGVCLTFLVLTYIYAVPLNKNLHFGETFSVLFSWLGLVGAIVVFTIIRVISKLAKVL